MFSMAVQYLAQHGGGSAWREVASTGCWKDHHDPHTTSQSHVFQIGSRRILDRLSLIALE